MQQLDIAEVSSRAGVPASTLRYYEERGLIVATGRRGLRRQFDPSVLERLAIIALASAAGLSLQEIVHMFEPDGRLHVDRQLLLSKADALDDTVHRLRAMSKGLRHAAACRAPSHMECPTFRRLLRAATTAGRPARKEPRPPPKTARAITGRRDRR